MAQQQLVFFAPSSDEFYNDYPRRPSDQEITMSLARNGSSPLNKIIVSSENEGNYRILNRLCFTAYSRFNRSCRGLSFAIFCPPGQGKTFIVKKFAETIGIPFVFVQSSGLKDTYDLFQQISKVLEEAGIPLEPHKDPKHDYILPPCLVFFDEAHEIKSDLQKGALLNPMEPDDGIMHIKEPGSNQIIRVNCKQICWIAATTDPADLFDAFRMRFLNHIEWVPAGPEEVPEIIHAGLKEKFLKKEIRFVPTLEQCKVIARYQMIPRLAIHGFGTQAVIEQTMHPTYDWEDVCLSVAKDLQSDEWGMTKRQVQILSALGQRPMAKAKLADVCHCRISQVESMELPALMQYNNGGPFCVSISGRGMCITEAGTKELDKRGVSHLGRKVTAEYFEAKR